MVAGNIFRPSTVNNRAFCSETIIRLTQLSLDRDPVSGSKTTNEKWGSGKFYIRSGQHLFISGGCDVQHFPWLKYRCSAPSCAIRQEIKVKFFAFRKTFC